MFLFNYVAQHAEVGVVGDAGLPDGTNRCAECALRAIDRLTLGEIELVERAPPAHAAVAAEFDPLRVGHTLTNVNRYANVATAMLEEAGEPCVRLVRGVFRLILTDLQRTVR